MMKTITENSTEDCATRRILINESKTSIHVENLKIYAELQFGNKKKNCCQEIRKLDLKYEILEP